MIGLRSLLAALLVLVLTRPGLAAADASASPAGAAAAAAESDNAYLNELNGEWDMSGTLDGKPVHYHANGVRVLQGGFLRLHMLDAAPNPAYEADLYIGFDPQRRDFVAHWLDRFGAAGARVVGIGRRHDAQLVILFPYISGTFRDTFTFIPDRGAWSLLLESEKPDGAWSTFANYTLERAR